MRLFSYIFNWASIACLAVTACLAVSCGEKDPDFRIEGEPGANQGASSRRPQGSKKKVLLFYECGFNSLYKYIDANINEQLVEGYVPGGSFSSDVLLAYTKIASSVKYAPAKSYLKRIYKDKEGKVAMDTLKVYDESVIAASGKQMRTVLEDVRNAFPGCDYGMVFSSHGSGWLPCGYYNNPSDYENNHGMAMMSSVRRLSGVPTEPITEGIPTRSLGQDKAPGGDHEMTVGEFASGIPYHLDYILFDMCFTAGVEVLHGLKDVTDYVGASAAEVLADGMFDYTKITSYLLGRESYDLAGLMRDSFERYDKLSGDYRSSTVSLLSTEGADKLASTCRGLFGKYRDALAEAPVEDIQRYFRFGRHYFYDLYDTFVKCGASGEDLARLSEAIDGCVAYKASTPYLLGIKIDTHSGLSTYLPAAGTDLLDRLYKEESWNKATEMVR